MSETVGNPNRESTNQGEALAMRASRLWADIRDEAQTPKNQSPIDLAFQADRNHPDYREGDKEIGDMLKVRPDGVNPVRYRYEELRSQGATEGEVIEEMQKVVDYLDRIAHYMPMPYEHRIPGR